MLVQPQSSARLASLLAGDVDAIDAVSFTDVAAPEVGSAGLTSSAIRPAGWSG